MTCQQLDDVQNNGNFYDDCNYYLMPKKMMCDGLCGHVVHVGHI